ncbi:hypothetical protein DL96DRAFT_14975 [Flagelloscypha sp. PMI_526]|nr:hypothetical protein DL96DRAFT_14975 [Flagelloscypha sp. PMI_526]
MLGSYKVQKFVLFMLAQFTEFFPSARHYAWFCITNMNTMSRPCPRPRSYSLSNLDRNGIPNITRSYYLMAYVPSPLSLVRTSAAPIKQLPNELFIEILKCLAGYIDIVEGVLPICSFAQVCRHWRQLAFQTNYLWRFLHFSSIPLSILGPDGFAFEEYLNTTFSPLYSLLNLSKNQRLDIIFDWDEGNEFQWDLETFAIYFGPLLDQSWRWGSLVIPEYMLCFLKELNIEMPDLTSLTLSRTCSSVPKAVVYPPSLSLEDALTVLEGSPALEHIDLSQHHIDLVTFPTMSLKAINIQTQLEFLFTSRLSFPKLAHLTLTSPSGTPLDERIVLPELRRLHIIDCEDIYAPRAIFNSLRCPKLEHFELDAETMLRSSWDALKAMLEDSKAVLRKLVLHECSFVSSELATFLQNTKGITYLVIEGVFSGVVESHDGNQVLAATEDTTKTVPYMLMADSNLLPNLEELAVKLPNLREWYGVIFARAKKLKRVEVVAQWPVPSGVVRRCKELKDEGLNIIVLDQLLDVNLLA